MQKIRTAIEMKQYIYHNNKIPFILEAIGCSNIRKKDNLYICSNPDGDNTAAVAIKDSQFLSMTNYTRKTKQNADLLSLVEDSKGYSNLPQTLKYLCNLLNVEYVAYYKKTKTSSIYPSSDKLSQVAEIEEKQELSQNKPIDEKILNDFVPMLYVDWMKKDGIIEKTRKKFGICYSYKEKRIIIPIRDYKTGNLIALSKRTTVENYDIWGIPKYFLTPTYKKSLNIFGLWENREYIKKVGYCSVFEGYKSVFKRDSLTDASGLAIEGHSLSEQQANILVELDVEIIICMDKDVRLDEILFMCEKIKSVSKDTKVSYIFDTQNLLGEKDSPADKGNKVFQELFQNRVAYNEFEHQQYLQSLNCKY